MDMPLLCKRPAFYCQHMYDDVMSMGYCNKYVTPVREQQNYVFLALRHRDALYRYSMELCVNAFIPRLSTSIKDCETLDKHLFYHVWNFHNGTQCLAW